MSSTSSNLPRTFIDTTVLCGAIRVNGLNRRLLELAQASFFYIPVISKVCLFEFYNQALNKGISHVIYDIETLDLFMEDWIYPILEEHHAINTRVGRYSFESKLYSNRPIGEVLSEQNAINRSCFQFSKSFPYFTIYVTLSL